MLMIKFGIIFLYRYWFYLVVLLYKLGFIVLIIQFKS
ncbi:hypothetical protein FLJU110815_19225 [Flavobacterium jumunjinense]